MTATIQKTLCALILFFPLMASSQALSGQKALHDSMAVDIAKTLLESFAGDLRLPGTNGTLILYEDSLCKIPYSEEAIPNLFVAFESHQIINPANPDDPYDLIDTLVPYSRSLHPKQWKEIRNNYDFVLVRLSDTQFFYIRVPEFDSTLGNLKAHAVFFDILKGKSASGNDFHQLLQERVNIIEFILYEELTKIQSALYLPSTEQNFREYNFCAQREHMQYLNPLPPDDPYDFIDSVFITPMKPEFLDHLFFQNATRAGEIERGVVLTAISYDCVCSHVYRATDVSGKHVEIHRRASAQGWLSWKDAQKHFSREDLRLLLYLNAWNLLH